MDRVNALENDHVRLKEELATITAHLFLRDRNEQIARFVADYDAHEAAEDAILEELTELNSKEVWPVKGYHNIHSGGRALLNELQNMLDGGSALSVERALYHFTVFALSHFQYEEQWIFPLMRAALQKPPDSKESGPQTLLFQSVQWKGGEP